MQLNMYIENSLRNKLSLYWKNNKLIGTTLFRIFIPDSFNTNISHQVFNYTLTFVNKKALKQTFQTGA